MINDPIADMLIRIKNGLAVQKKEVVIPMSKIKLELTGILKEEGYIEDYVSEGKDFQDGIRIILGSESASKPRIRELVRISKPGRRIYRGYNEIGRVKEGMGISIISTSEGLMTGEKAREKKLGGELICEVF